MFTGIITAIGQIQKVEALNDAKGVRVCVSAPEFDLKEVQLGDSIALNGACMTVIQRSVEEHCFSVDVSFESLQKTVGLNQVGYRVNLERALRFGQTLDGHLVLGHVDGVGRILTLEHQAESVLLTVWVPVELSPYLAYKGSIAVNGVSLTINQVRDHQDGTEVDINLIPHTWAHTQFSVAKEGDEVNLEMDSLARYIGRYLERTRILEDRLS